LEKRAATAAAGVGDGTVVTTVVPSIFTAITD